MSNSPLIAELFADVFKKRDHRLKLWIVEAEFHLRKKTEYDVVRHYTGEDIVLDIVTNILTGSIKWDIERVPNINTFMYNQIRGRVSNLTKREINRLHPFGSQKEYLPGKLTIKDPDECTGETLNEIISRQDRNDLRKFILKQLDKDSVAYCVFEEIITGRGDIAAAESLGIPVSQVVRAKKRIIHLIKKFKE